MELLSPADVPWFMWKTGTSAGRRDAWAVGHNRRFAAGVWVGRFAGGGSPDFVGGEAAEPLLAALFALPAIRNDADPPPARPWTVVRPLPRPPELASRICGAGPAGPEAPLSILTPSAGTTFRAINGQAVIHARTNSRGELHWFLNGRLLELAKPSDPGSLEDLNQNDALFPSLPERRQGAGQPIEEDRTTPLRPSTAIRLVLPPGAYDLRCADPAGDAAAVRFVVR